ncbi:uncharacterized protein LOC117652630 isoform X3 [Thrips palmi]|uniref:Uncharacterized protein LOC117652630 isoform X3 n=1 Tax=Thrips palmi TaxID=161013 RepID=A0A6P9ACF8_THRPL|nr:uncharacterized protein LOC117652630 isoform X3 [Thrips palmi]
MNVGTLPPHHAVSTNSPKSVSRHSSAPVTLTRRIGNSEPCSASPGSSGGATSSTSCSAAACCTDCTSCCRRDCSSAETVRPGRKCTPRMPSTDDDNEQAAGFTEFPVALLYRSQFAASDLHRPATATAGPTTASTRSSRSSGPSSKSSTCPPPPAAWLLDTAGCRVPAHQPFSREVMPMVYDFPTITCADPPPLVRSNDTHLLLAAGLAAKYNASSVACCFTAMWRVRGPRWQDDRGVLDDGVAYGNDIRFADDCVPFNDSIAVPHEFVRVTCTDPASPERREVYLDYFGFVPVRRPRGASAGASAREHVSEDALSVLVVGMDSLSRLNMIRKMPKTRAFLERRLAASSMLGYNKVEDNTFPNLVPLLSGLSVPELKKACWTNSTTHFDACPWIWKSFNAKGYVSMFAEDTAWMGLFHYLSRGFVNQPTDYDPRPLLYIGEKHLARGGGNNAQYCIGQRHQIEVLFDYGLKFVRGMATQRRKFFSVIWGTSLSHDLLNQPDEADAMYERFLADIHDTGVLNSTALVFLSDHGLRFGNVLKTYQGHLENMLPTMYVVLPDWVRRRYKQAVKHLQCNRHRLLTVYDLHRTLGHMTDLSTLEDERVLADSDRVRRAFSSKGPQGKRRRPRAIGLTTAIPSTRTCQDAGIPTNFCACQHLTKAQPFEVDVQFAAAFVVREMNALLSRSPQCWNASLDAVLDARRGAPLRTGDLAEDADEREYQMRLRTQPGNALLSAAVRVHVKTGRMQLAGSIGRLNAYGNTSWLCPCPSSLPSLRLISFRLLPPGASTPHHCGRFATASKRPPQQQTPIVIILAINKVLLWRGVSRDCTPHLQL